MFAWLIWTRKSQKVKTTDLPHFFIMTAKFYVGNSDPDGDGQLDHLKTEVWICNICHRLTCFVNKKTSVINWAIDETTHRFRHRNVGKGEEGYTSFHSPFF